MRRHSFTLLAAQTPARPNVVILLADDLNYADVGAQDRSVARTSSSTTRRPPASRPICSVTKRPSARSSTSSKPSAARQRSDRGQRLAQHAAERLQGPGARGRHSHSVLRAVEGQAPAGPSDPPADPFVGHFPTSISAIGGATPSNVKLDGVNLLPLIFGQTQASPHEALYWRFGAQWAVRAGDLKFVHRATGEEGLYDLASDVGEQSNLSKTRPADPERLKTLYATWNSEFVKPLWGQGAPGRQAKKAARLAGEKGPATQSATDPNAD